MLRKLAAAAAATVVMAIGTIAWADPAQAAPGGACGVEEWRNPANFTDCVKRTRGALTDKAGCVTAPTPGSPTSGLAGMFATEPDTARRSGVQGQYSLYGVGGYGFDTYDIGCLGNLKHPNLVAVNSFASGEMTVAAAVLGAANGLRERAYNPQSMWSWSDEFVREATTAIYKYVFSVFGAITVVVAGLFLLWTARLGNLPQAMRVAGWALFVFVLATSVARWPVQSVRAADNAATAVLETMHSVLGPGPQNLPADQCILGGDSCTDRRTVATRSSDVATEAILYRPWLRGALGDADTETARKYGPALFDATTMTWAEADRSAGPELRAQLIERKAQAFTTIAEQIRTEDPVAYEHLQGIHSGDRAGAGFFAMASSFVFSLFDSIASLVVLASYGLFRLGIVFLPLLATVGIFLHASALVRRVINMMVAAMFNIAVFGAVAGAYLWLSTAVFRSTLPAFIQIVVVLMTGIVALVVTRPIRQITSTATGRSRDSDGILTRAFNSTKQAMAKPVADTDDDGTDRPETATQTPRRRAARHVVNVLAPSVGEVVRHPVVAAANEAATNRPEGSTFGEHVRTVVTAAATAAAAGPAAGAAVAAARDPRPETTPRS